MKYFYDTEFIENGFSVDLISIGIVAEDGREYYAQDRGCPLYQANDWVKENVLPHLTETDWKFRPEIKEDILRFIGDDKPEFWGYYSAYDHVALCQLFGAMIDLPKGWPMYTRDIKQLCDSLGNPRLPEQGKGEHNALADARWNKLAYEWLVSRETEAEANERRRQSGYMRAEGG